MMDEQKRQEELQALKQDIFESLHCALPGKVVSFDADSQTVVIQPAVKTASGVELPVLRDVPVFMPVSFEIQEGDACLVIFADRDIDAWFETGESSVPPSGRMHSLSDGFAFVGFRTRGNTDEDASDG